MLTTKSRKQGSSVVVTLPSEKGAKPEADKEYIVVYSENGSITLVPKIEDPFAGNGFSDMVAEDEWEDMKPAGREIW